MRKISHEEIAVTMHLKGFKIHVKPFMLNIIGVRSLSQEAGKYDDAILFFRRKTKGWDWMQCDATTDPGLYYLQNPLREEGTLIMCPGHYPDFYKSGPHRGKSAFRQNASGIYVRDNNKDEYLDLALMNAPSNRIAGNFFTNLHKGYKEVRADIGRYSAGCQVVNDDEQFDIAKEWRDEQIQKCNLNSFNYTLLLESELTTY